METTRVPRDCGFRTCTTLVLALTLSTFLALAGGTSGPATAADGSSAPAVPGELIVGFEKGASQSEQSAAVAAAGATQAARFSEIRAVLLRVPPQQTNATTKLLLGNPRVRYVEPNHILKTAETPDDPSYSQLWGMHNTGQTGGTPDADIDAPEAWDVTRFSSNIVVGVTDTGVDFSHPDLADQQWVNPGENCGSSDPTVPCDDRTDTVDDDLNGYVDDWRGWDWVNDDNDPFDDNRHGTHVAGTIGAVGSNGVGVVGVNWDVQIMALKFLDASGQGTTADAVAATLYAAESGAHVSSNSWGGGPYDQSLRDAIEFGGNLGMLFVAAAGNDGRSNETTPTYPGSYASEAIVTVAATDHLDGLALFSNYGKESVDLGAPGVNILSTTPGGAYQALDGTSMATPHVAGVAALLYGQHYHTATPYGIKALLLRSVDPVSSLDGKTTTGGRLNAFTAVSCVDAPKVWLDAPAQSFVAGVGDDVPVSVLASTCATPAGLSNVSVTVNGDPVGLTESSPGLYRGNFTVGAEGPLTVTAEVTVGGTTVTQTATGAAYHSYTCDDVPQSWVDVTGGTLLTGAGSDDSMSTLAIGFPVAFFGETYSTAYVSSNGFLTLGSSAGATAPENVPIPTGTAPNGLIAPLWDDLNPRTAGDVYAGVTGTAPNRALHIEWHDVPHFSWTGSGQVTFEATVWENGDVRFQYQDTDFDDPAWDAGASATAGIERPDGVIGHELSFEQPLLTSGRAVMCSYSGAAPVQTPPSAPTGLSAAAGDNVVHLDWTAPSDDGGSPVTGYRVYRGESPGTGDALTDVGAVTSFADTTAVNGVTYYYGVSALNAIGESPRSNEASATPETGVPPVEPLPVVDSFNRPDENPLSDAGKWANGISGTGERSLRVLSNQLAGTKSTTVTAWRTSPNYGPDVEVWTRVSVLPGNGNQLRLYARLRQPGSAAYDGYLLRANPLSGTDQVQLERVDNGVIVNLTTVGHELAAGDTLLLRVQGSTLEAWRQRGSTWTRLASATDTTYTATGLVGVGLRGTAGRLDDFGARKLPGPPSAPTALSAVDVDDVVQLSWTAPTDTGGSPVTGYRVYRGESPGTGGPLADVGAVTSFDDTTAFIGVTYYYRVSALNALGESPLSNEASATPGTGVPPVEPLPVVDSFNRPDENPLSGGFRWSNGIAGTGERSLSVVSNQCAGTKTTTTTAWRATSYGPNVEVWARVSVLPGDGNQVRLYARLQQPGSSAYDAYMLRANQLSGTDQVLLERVDNGVIVNLLTMSQELAVGDTLLLRVQGTTLEAWRRAGGTWTRLGSATDATYTTAGRVGLGIRGLTGRLDDFGARTKA